MLSQLFASHLHYVSVVIITCLALTSTLIVLQSGSLNDVPVANTASLHLEATAVQKGDLEKGKDTFLVEWDGPTDPDVSCRVMLIQTSNTCLRACWEKWVQASKSRPM